MTGLTDSDANPVHSVAEVEGLNLLEPASKAEYLRKNKYYGKTDLIVRFLALQYLKNEVRIAKIWRDFVVNLQKYYKTYLLILVFLILSIFWNRSMIWEKLIDVATYITKEWNERNDIERKLIYTVFVAITFTLSAPLTGFKALPFWPEGAKTRNQNFDENCRQILISDSNPEWMNSWLYNEAWPSLLTATNKNDTREQSHAHSAFERSEKIGKEGTIWRSMPEKSLHFLLNWMKGGPKERIPIVLWCFNPPKEDNNWGDNRDRLIKDAETRFASDIYTLLYGLSDGGGAIYDEFIQQAEENEKSFEWLKEQMVSIARHEPPCVQLLNLWSHHHYSKD